jgi:hypothetical protein
MVSKSVPPDTIILQLKHNIQIFIKKVLYFTQRQSFLTDKKNELEKASRRLTESYVVFYTTPGFTVKL